MFNKFSPQTFLRLPGTNRPSLGSSGCISSSTSPFTPSLSPTPSKLHRSPPQYPPPLSPSKNINLLFPPFTSLDLLFEKKSQRLNFKIQISTAAPHHSERDNDPYIADLNSYCFPPSSKGLQSHNWFSKSGPLNLQGATSPSPGAPPHVLLKLWGRTPLL